MEAKRITWLDGVKGFACLAVMWHHFVLSFLPQLYSDEISTMKSVSELDRKLQQSPFLFWLNGDFMVMLFLTISGIVMSKKVIELTDKTSLSEIIVKRYFRLLLPFVPLAIMTYLFIQFGWFRNGEAGIISTSMWLSTCHAEQMSFLRFIFETVIHTWFGGDNNFGLSCVFWMLPAIFQGSFLVIILGTITWKVKPLKSLLIFLVLAAIMIFVQPLYTPFCLGAVFSVYYKNYFNKKNKWGGAIALILGCFLGGYPTGVSPTNVYRHLNFLPDYIITYLFWHLIGGSHSGDLWSGKSMHSSEIVIAKGMFLSGKDILCGLYMAYICSVYCIFLLLYFSATVGLQSKKCVGRYICYNKYSSNLMGFRIFKIC